MAQSEPVEVAVKIIDKFSKDLENLERKLTEIDGKKLDVAFDIDDEGQIESVKKQLKRLEKKLEATLDIDVNSAVAQAKRKALERDMHSTLHVNTRKHGGSGLTGFASTGGNPKTGPPAGIPNPLTNVVQSGVIENLEAVHGTTSFRPPALADDPDAFDAVNEIINDNVAGAMGVPPSHRERVQDGFGISQQINPDFSAPNQNPKTATGDFMESIRKATSGFEVDAGKVFSKAKFGDLEIQAKGVNMDLFTSGRGGGTYPFSRKQRLTRSVSKAGQAARAGVGAGVGAAGRFVESTDDLDLGEMNAGFSSLIKKLGRFKPNIMMVWNFLALLIPVLVTLAGAAIGAAAALVALGTAGAAIVGLGLLGYGENAAESMEMLKAKVSEVKAELFEALRPAMKAMNPIADQWLSSLAPAVERLTAPLSRLAGYEGFLAGVGDSAIEFVIGFLAVINRLRPRVEAIGTVLGTVFSGFNIMDWGINELYDNMGAFLQLGGILLSLIVILYNVSKAVAFAVSPFAPLFRIVARLSGLLSNKWTSALLSAVGAALLLYGAVVGLNMILAALSYTAIAGAVGSLATLIWSFLMLATNAIMAAVSGISTIISSLGGMVVAAISAIGAMSALNAVLATTVALLAATGIGLALIGGGLLLGGALKGTHRSAGDVAGGSSGYNGYDGGMGGGSTINIYGDVGNSEYQKMMDQFPELSEEQVETRNERQK
ncbi:MFS transporter [Halonotius roseus]|uniref:MFS transporter n=1 Tax=Halonotius roseus TaxID=2511997 RepID=A0A544QQY6_9EURY|nr:MFS transporter [Halonotius roseus]TQQ81848.1 MFS transporter [Halonotius roseus]